MSSVVKQTFLAIGSSLVFLDDFYQFVIAVSGKHYVILESIEESGRLHRDMGERLFMSPTVTLAPLTQTPEQYAQKFNTKVLWWFILTCLSHSISCQNS